MKVEDIRSLVASAASQGCLPVVKLLADRNLSYDVAQDKAMSMDFYAQEVSLFDTQSCKTSILQLRQ